MKIFKKILAIVLAVISLSVPVTISASAATTYTSNVAMAKANGGYRSNYYSAIYNQGVSEKAITLKKGKNVKITPAITKTPWNALKKLNSYVRFVVWIYNINTGKREYAGECKAGQTIIFKNNNNATSYYSIQVRAYLHRNAWGLNLEKSNLNWYLTGSNFKATLKY